MNLYFEMLSLNFHLAKNQRLLTPHSAGVTKGAYKRMVEEALLNMARTARGEQPHNLL